MPSKGTGDQQDSGSEMVLMVRDALSAVGTFPAAFPAVGMFLLTMVLCYVFSVGFTTLPLVVVGTLLGITLGRGLEDHQRKREEYRFHPQRRWAIAQRVRNHWARAQMLPAGLGEPIALSLEDLWYSFEGGLIPEFCTR